MRSTDILINICGSPFVEEQNHSFSDSELLKAYEVAFPDRVALLYLTKHRKDGWDARLEDKYQALHQRRLMTIKVVASLAETMNSFYSENYVIFKSVKPYPATPNDTDVLFLGEKKQYEKAYRFLLNQGYKFHEWAPQQRTLYDPRGEGKIGQGKKGGTYYIDFYEEISTDYYAYLNKKALIPYIIKQEINGIPVNLLRPEPELAIVLFHNVFPERTYQLEHFYLPLYYLSNPEFDKELFISFVRRQNLEEAVKVNLTFCSYLHQKYFNFVPEPITYLLNQLGTSNKELQRFIEHGAKTPYMFSPRQFFKTFFHKSLDSYALKSLFIQSFKMLNPIFLLDVMKSLKNRLSQEGTYHLE